MIVSDDSAVRSRLFWQRLVIIFEGVLRRTHDRFWSVGIHKQLVIIIHMKNGFKLAFKSLPRNLFLIFLPQFSMSISSQGTFCSVGSASRSSSRFSPFDSFAAHLSVLFELIIVGVFTLCVWVFRDKLLWTPLISNLDSFFLTYLQRRLRDDINNSNSD